MKAVLSYDCPSRRPALGYPQRSHAFTLVELLVVIGIIAVLMGILLPMASKVRAQSRMIGCQSNIRTLYTACIAFGTDNRGAMPVPSIIGEGPSDPDVVAKCVWPMDKSGVVNLQVGALWKYLAPTSEGRKNIIFCPSDNSELETTAGVKPNVDRNFSYSFNANLRSITNGLRVSVPLRLIIDPAQKIMIWEEIGPNDAWCLNPNSNIDDRPTGRHGRVDSLKFNTPEYNAAGRGNFGFFDGHVETLSPGQIIGNLSYYTPIK